MYSRVDLVMVGRGRCINVNGNCAMFLHVKRLLTARLSALTRIVAPQCGKSMYILALPKRYDVFNCFSCLKNILQYFDRTCHHPNYKLVLILDIITVCVCHTVFVV